MVAVVARSLDRSVAMEGMIGWRDRARARVA